MTNEILQKKDTRGSFRNWSQQVLDLSTTILHMSHGMGGYDMTPNDIVQISFLVFEVLSHRFTVPYPRFWFFVGLSHC